MVRLAIHCVCCVLAFGWGMHCVAQDATRRFEDFSTDPTWESYRNRLLPHPLPVTRQDFGWRAKAHAGSGRDEIGGWIQRSLTPAWFAKPIQKRTLNDRLSASGKFAVTREVERGKTVYDVEATVNGQHVEYVVDAADGKVLGTEVPIEFSQLPEPVRAAAEKHFGTTSGLTAMKCVEYGETLYEIEGKRNGKTWYGYAGWGVLDYFVEQPGRYTLAEAFFANQMALIHRLTNYFPELANAEADARGRSKVAPMLSDRARTTGLTLNDARGLLFDRDVVAFYGDPAWVARMAEHPKAFDQALRCNANEYMFEIKPNRGERSFEAVNRNGSQRVDGRS